MSIGDAIAAAAQLGAGNRTQWPLVTREVTGETRGVDWMVAAGAAPNL